MRITVSVPFEDGAREDVTIDVTDPAMILNDASGLAGKLLGDMVLGDLVEAHGPVAGPPRPVHHERADSWLPHNRLSRSMTLAREDAA